MKDFLNDKAFLDKVDRLKIKEQFIRLTVLSWSEDPICEIQGKALSGSLNIDGTSSMRRTGNLSLYADTKINDLTNFNNEIAINRKVKVELGIKNTVPPTDYSYFDKENIFHEYWVNYQDKYGEILWYPLGIYVMFNPNISYSAEGLTISLSLQDKMCLLNGTAGGVIPAAVTFSEMEYEDENGNIKIDHPTIRQIIEELVNHFGKEKLVNILISDLSETAKQVVKYIGGDEVYYYEKNGPHYELDYDKAVAGAGSAEALRIFEPGMDIGFKQTPFTYPGELTCNPGGTVTSVLDDIIKVLGNYEYYYDIDGVFHFQEIKNYLNTTKAKEILNKINGVNGSPDYEVQLTEGKAVYTFNGVELLTSINNTPNWEDVKNDFVIWGARKGIDGTEYPIRYHLAIDKQPEIQGYTKDNKPYYGKHYNIIFELDEFGNWLPKRAKEDNSKKVTVYTRDYREELYYQGWEAAGSTTDESDFTAEDDSNYYYTELSTEFPKIYDFKKQEFKIKDPTAIDFYLDIIDSGAEVGKYSVETMGRRSKVIQENTINCIFESDIPDVVFLNPKDFETPEEYWEEKDKLDKQGQIFYQIDDTFNSVLATGGVLNSAYYRMSELLYENTNLNSTISVSSIPIYYLEPNTRITLNVEKAGVAGDYVMQSISLPLDISSTMEISAYKAIERL